MNSSFINETLKQSIHQLENITDELYQQVAELNINNPNVGLAIDSTTNDEAEVIRADLNDKLMIVQTSFDTISSLVLRVKDPNFMKGIKLDEVIKALQPFQNGSIVEKIDINSRDLNEFESKYLELIKKLEKLVLLYSIAAIYQILLTRILRFTVPLNDSYYYYDVTAHSNWRTVLYSLQTFPNRVVRLVGSVVNDISSTEFPTIDSSYIHSTPAVLEDYPTIARFYKYSTFYLKIISNSLYNNILTNNIKGFYKLGVDAFKWNSIGLRKTTRTFIDIKDYIKILIGTPFNSIHEELKAKRSEINAAQTESAKVLGFLVTNIPNFEELMNNDTDQLNEFSHELISKTLIRYEENEASSKDSFITLFKFTSFISTELKDSKTKSKLKHLSRPDFLTRYWPTILITILYGPSTIRTTIMNWDLILKFIKENLIDTCVKFYENWILKPLTDIFSTIRHDSNSEISIMSQNSLTSELDSLKRMVIDYTIETNSSKESLSNDDINLMKVKLDELVTKGDLTPFMEGYESDIKSPLKNLINGKLTRGLLIQLQKTKVDGSVAISGIDKLLKSQQLVFGIIAASPSLIIVIYISNLIKSFMEKGYITRDLGQTKLIISKNLNNIERLLNKLNEGVDEDESNIINGLLLLEIISLRKNGFGTIPKNRRDEWIRDVNDLIKSDGTARSHISFKLNTVNRIYNVYGRFF